MKTVTKKFTISTAYGQPLDTPIESTFSFEQLEKGDEIPAKEQPDADDILNMVNAKRNASARAKATTEALNAAGIEKPSTDTPEYRRNQIIKALVANGQSQAEAEATALALIP